MQSIPNMSPAYDPDLAAQLQKDILEEIYKAAKIPKIQMLRNSAKHLFSNPTRRFSGFIAEIDKLIEEKGLVIAAQKALLKLCNEVIATGQEKIPPTGSLIIASNHPGTYDGFSIISQLPRNDIKLVVSGIPFFRNLPNASKCLIFATRDINERMNVIRKAIRHLKDGGMLLIFPSGRLDPDPSLFPSAEESFNQWSRSLEVFMGKAPETKLVLAVTSGVLTKEFINHPITLVFKNDHERRRIIEFMQVIKQMMQGKPVDLKPKVTFAEPFSVEEIRSNANGISNSLIKTKIHHLFNHHISLYYPKKKP